MTRPRLNPRRTKWLVFVIWVLVVGVTGSYAGKLAEAQENDATSFLPASADSTQVVQLSERFEDSDVVTSIIVYKRDSGLTDADRLLARDQIERIAESVPGLLPAPPASELGNGTTLLQPVLQRGSDSPDDSFFEEIEAIREVTGTGGDGLQIALTGQGASIYDGVSVFDGLDKTILIATASVVTVLLLLIYRSPVLWVIPLIAVAAADGLASWVVYVLATEFGLTVNGQSAGLLPILVFGAGTDYALLLIARYREELHRHVNVHKAMLVALCRSVPAIAASGATVIAGLLCLVAADLNSTKGFGPIGAIGIGAAMLSMLTLLPALLVLLGRRIFWPFVPRFGPSHERPRRGWATLGDRLQRHPRRIWLTTSVILVACVPLVVTFPTGLDYADTFRDEPESVTGQELIAASGGAGRSQPLVVIGPSTSIASVEERLARTDGVVDFVRNGFAFAQWQGTIRDDYFGFPQEPNRETELTRWNVTLDAGPSTDREAEVIEDLRTGLDDSGRTLALVGGGGAQTYDTEQTSIRDTLVVVPLVLLVVLAILVALLRSLVAPLLLIASVIVSFAATIGVSAVVFEHVFDFAGFETGTLLLSFVFLVALGVDYNIFLMARAREESETVDTRDGMKRALAVTGGVITSAGIVLAGTFSVFIAFPLVALAQTGFIVAFGVLLDTFVVRSLLVPALALDIGAKIWWPDRLARRRGRAVPAAR